MRPVPRVLRGRGMFRHSRFDDDSSPDTSEEMMKRDNGPRIDEPVYNRGNTNSGKQESKLSLESNCSAIDICRQEEFQKCRKNRPLCTPYEIIYESEMVDCVKEKSGTVPCANLTCADKRNSLSGRRFEEKEWDALSVPFRDCANISKNCLGMYTFNDDIEDFCVESAMYKTRDYPNFLKRQEGDGPVISRLVVPIVIPLTIIVFVLIIALIVIWRLRHRRAVLPLKTDVVVSMTKDGNLYSIVTKPEVNDMWELEKHRLELLNELGQGAFGKVYKGKVSGTTTRHTLFKSKFVSDQEKCKDIFVAVKQCHEYADEFTKREFLREIMLMKKIGYHEKLVNMLYCVTVAEPLSLIVEFCTEGDLLHFLRKRRHALANVNHMKADENISNHPIEMRDLVSFAFQISDGMQYLSQKGYVHCDLAARNIMVDQERVAKIGDFGLCRYLQHDCVYISKGGRLPIKWMALEAIQKYEFTTETDIWSFGVVLFEIVTLGGSPYPEIMPSDGDFRLAMLTYLRGGNRMAKPSNCPDEIYTLMQTSWHANPVDRPSFTAIKESLRQLLVEISTTDYYRDFYINPDESYYRGEGVLTAEDD